MSLYMINVRMRRVEAITKHSRWDPNGHYKAYQGSRMWTLTDAQVFASESKALKALKWELERLKNVADQRHKKLIDDLKLIDEAIVGATMREDTAAKGFSTYLEPICIQCRKAMPIRRLQEGKLTCGIGSCP